MFKSDDEVIEMLEHKNNATRVIGIGRGNSVTSGGNASGNHITRTTDEKANIAVLATLIGNKPAGNLLGVNPDHVSHLRNGHNGDGKANLDLIEATEKRLGNIRSRAIDKVELFMEMLSTEKAIKMRGKDMASAAEKFVNIYEKLGPKLGSGIAPVQIIFHAPKIRVSSDYPVIDVEAIEN